MLSAAERLRQEYPDRVELLVAEGVPFAQYQSMMDGSDVILDQLYSYTPAMNALLAMSKGIICVGGGEPEHYDLLGEKELRPIVNVEPDEESVYQSLENLMLHPELVPKLKRESMEYVRRHHDVEKVAKEYEKLYLGLMSAGQSK
jgi:glycosyltransferase involved in cell wall biosynthesis